MCYLLEIDHIRSRETLFICSTIDKEHLTPYGVIMELDDDFDK
jgi:hypothetical protein